MASSERDIYGIVPSLVDRLLDDNPDVQQEPIASRYQDVRDLRVSVARDLENLLNTRRESLDELPPEFTDLNRSLLVYGLPEFMAFNLLDPSDLGRLRRAIESAIANFEPRLQRVRVQMEPLQPNDRAVRFRIEAMLRVDPAPEPVVFDTVLQLGRQEYLVKGQD
jgi:type VI secretion system protein ImpF